MKRFQKWIQNIHRLADILFLYTVMVGVALGLYMVQKFFSPFFHNIAQKNLTFVLSLTEWLRDPFQLVANNIRIVPLYVVWESGWILALVGVWGIYRMLRAREPVGLLLLAYLVIPFVLVVFFNKVVYPRYLIFFAGFLMMGAVYVLSTAPSWIRQKATVGICLLLFVQCIPQWFAVNSISLPPVDRGQYIEGSSAVWGADDLMDQVRLATKDGKRATVLAEGDFGLIADVLEVFKRPDDIIDIRGKWPLNEVHIREVQREVGKTHAFVVFSHRKDFPVHWEQELIHLVKVYTKPGTSGEKVYLFRILPSSPKL
jgi:hypothetical protein